MACTFSARLLTLLCWIAWTLSSAGLLGGGETTVLPFVEVGALPWRAFGTATKWLGACPFFVVAPPLMGVDAAVVVGFTVEMVGTESVDLVDVRAGTGGGFPECATSTGRISVLSSRFFLGLGSGAEKNSQSNQAGSESGLRPGPYLSHSPGRRSA